MISKNKRIKLIVIISSILFLNIFSLTPAAVFAQDSSPLISYCDNNISHRFGETQTNLDVDFALNEIIGNTVTTFSTLTDNEGLPIVGAPILFYVSNEDEQSKWIGHSITDCYGVAIMRIDRSKTGPIEITAKFEGGNGFTENEVTATMELKRLAEDNPNEIDLTMIGVTLMLLLVISAAIIGAHFAVIEDRKKAKSI